MKPWSRLDYIKMYAERLKKDNSLFKQQKIIIESQMKASTSIFKAKFGHGKKFRRLARNYLKRLENSS